MSVHCECGMTLEHERTRSGCRECGAVVCPSCALDVEAHVYCRWCAMSLAHGAA